MGACAGVSRRVAGMVLEELTRIATGEASATVRVAVVRAVAATLDADAGESPLGESPPVSHRPRKLRNSNRDPNRRDRCDPPSSIAGPCPAVADDALMSAALDSSDEVSNAAIEWLAPARRWRRRLHGRASQPAVPTGRARGRARGDRSRRRGRAVRVGTLSRALEAE